MDVRTARVTPLLCAAALALPALLLIAHPARAQLDAVAEADRARIEAGRTVAIQYTLSLDDGTTVQTNMDGPPLSYVAGEGQVIPGLEAALEGKSATDRVRVKISPEDAYGPVDAKLMQEIPLDRIPEDARRGSTARSGSPRCVPMRWCSTSITPSPARH